jgi:glutamyl-Q tRNA(Asp) synthetase
VPVLRNEHGEKLSKQTGAAAVAPRDAADAVAALLAAARSLGLPLACADSLDAFWRAAIPAWAALLEARRERV